MELCWDGHEEVCFYTKKCPVCEIISEHEAQIDDLERQLADAQEGE